VITAGNDRLVCGGGDDEMFGDFQEIGGPGTVRLGRDVFAFGAASGQDLVLDFQQGLDRLDVRGAGLTADEFATHVAGNVVDLEGGNGVTVTTLAGAPVALAPGDFLFA
jgi:Ca2+-binding RTX toxin-like protein